MFKRARGSSAVMLALAALLALGLAACGSDDDDDAADTDTPSGQEEGSDTIQIKYLDYAYDVSGPLNSGGTIEFENAGKEMHMMLLGKLKSGKTLDDVKGILASEGPDEEEGAAEEEAPTVETTAAEGGGGEEEGGGPEENPFADVMDEVGIPWNVMTPGMKAAVTVPDLAPGNYAMICFVPQEGTGQAHVALGMVNEMKVVEGDVAEPTADVTYKIEKGKAPAGPATLTAGTQTVKFEQVGDADELEPSMGRIDDGKTFKDADDAFNALFESEEPPTAGEGAAIPADVFIGGDFLGPKAYYLTLDFTPGNWVIVAEDSEDDDDPATPAELLEIKVT
jgi:hypothetical protein